jgi:23S rRNA (uracil1939-C5)-methyltransferase
LPTAVPQARPIARIEITSIAAGGDGVAHVDRPEGRRAVFVAASAPGDIVDAQIDFSGRPARATVLRLIQPSPHRVEPSCPHAGSCGGCDFMHLDLDAQRDAHRAIVASALERALHRTGVALPAIAVHAAPHSLGYRTRARLAIRARPKSRAPQAAGANNVIVGYRRAGRHMLYDVDSCIVLDPRLDGALPELRRLFQGENGEGEASVALGALGHPVVDIAWTGELSPGFFSRLSHLVEGGGFDGADVWLAGASRPARLGDPRAVTLGADGEPLTVPSGAFAQAHSAVNVELGERVLAVAEPTGRPVVELFAGSGNLTVLLARHALSLTAVESDGRAVEAAQVNLKARGLSARIVKADADEFALPANARVAVLDPPRAGAEGASRRLAASKVRRVAYISCDPSTLARDVALLVAAGFRPFAVETFEMFPHTSHVETLVGLDRRP